MKQFSIKYFNLSIILCPVLALIISCKTKATLQKPAKEKMEVATNQPTAYPTEPGTCIIQAYIIEILPIDKSIIDEPCHSFPCKARIVISKSNSCGFGVQRKPVVGDTLEVKFIHSLASSDEFKKVYPAKVVLPGLKQDQLFEAQIKIKMLPMEILVYEIGNYQPVH